MADNDVINHEKQSTSLKRYFLVSKHLDNVEFRYIKFKSMHNRTV